MTLNQIVPEDHKTFPLTSGELNIQDRFCLQWGQVTSGLTFLLSIRFQENHRNKTFLFLSRCK